MNKQGIKIQKVRIRLSKIQKYKPVNEKVLSIYYNTSQYKVDNEMFTFNTPEDMELVLLELDQYFLS